MCVCVACGPQVRFTTKHVWTAPHKFQSFDEDVLVRLESLTYRLLASVTRAPHHQYC